MSIYQNLCSFLKKVWYKCSPTAHNFAYLKEQLNVSAILLRDSKVQLNISTTLLQDNKEQLNDFAILLRDSREQFNDLAILLRDNNEQINDIVTLLQDSNEIRQSELLRDSQLIQKSDIPDIVRLCADLPQIAKEYISAHQMDWTVSDLNIEIYNSYKWIESTRLPEFICNRFAHDAIGNELQRIAIQHAGKRIYILTDFPNYNYPIKAITLSEVLDYAEEEAIFILLYRFDWNAIEAVHFFTEHKLKYQSPFQTIPMARYIHINRVAYETLIDEWMNSPHVHYCPVDFENIFQGLEVTRHLPGDYVEIGTFQGASARAALNYMRRTGIKKITYFLDTYEGFTYDNAKKSSDAQWYGTHTETSMDAVKEYLSQYADAKLIKSNICTDDLPEEITQIALCNIDVDIYDAVYAALKKVAPLIVEHGIIIAEDYGHTPYLIGAQYAVKKFLEESPGFMPLYFTSGQIMLIRIG